MRNTDVRNPDAMTAFTEQGIIPPLEPMPAAVAARLNRIEALRAASRVVARACHGGEIDLPKDAEFYESLILDVSEQLARWLEKGER